MPLYLKHTNIYAQFCLETGNGNKIVRTRVRAGHSGCTNLQAAFGWESHGQDAHSQGVLPMLRTLLLLVRKGSPLRLIGNGSLENGIHFQVLFSLLAFTLGKNDEGNGKPKGKFWKALASVPHTQLFYISTPGITSPYHKPFIPSGFLPPWHLHSSLTIVTSITSHVSATLNLSLQGAHTHKKSRDFYYLKYYLSASSKYLVITLPSSAAKLPGLCCPTWRPCSYWALEA